MCTLLGPSSQVPMLGYFKTVDVIHQLFVNVDQTVKNK